MKFRTKRCVFAFVVGVLSLVVIHLTPAISVATDLSLVGGSDIGMPTMKINGASVPGKTNPTFGGGALLDFRLNMALGLQLGALYMPRSSINTSNTPNVTTTVDTLQVPVLLRIRLLPAVSLGAGAYYAFGIGNVTTTINGNSSTQSYAKANMTTSDYGLVGSLAVNLPLSQRVAFLVDARYLYGLQNNSTTSNIKLNWADVQVLAGLMIHL